MPQKTFASLNLFLHAEKTFKTLNLNYLCDKWRCPITSKNKWDGFLIGRWWGHMRLRTWSLFFGLWYLVGRGLNVFFAFLEKIVWCRNLDSELFVWQIWQMTCGLHFWTLISGGRRWACFFYIYFCCCCFFLLPFLDSDIWGGGFVGTQSIKRKRIWANQPVHLDWNIVSPPRYIQGPWYICLLFENISLKWDIYLLKWDIYLSK